METTSNLIPTLREARFQKPAVVIRDCIQVLNLGHQLVLIQNKETFTDI